MIRTTSPADFEAIYTIINDGAQAYKGVVPADCLHEPYMSRETLQSEIDAGVAFLGWEESSKLAGVMGMQHVKDASLIRHAYVATAQQSKGIGGKLLAALKEQAKEKLLVGTWTAADWAIRFYERHGFRLVNVEKKEQLLMTYWRITPRQSETSVVLKYGTED